MKLTRRSHAPLVHILLVLLLTLSSNAGAQIYDPVQWELEIEPAETAPGSTVLARLTATIEDGWHIYSTTTPEGIALTLEIAEFEALVDWRPYQPSPEVVYDPNFQADVEWYTSSAEFLFELDLAATASGGHAIEAKVRYGACDYRQCLPPKRKSASAEKQFFQRSGPAPNGLCVHAVHIYEGANPHGQSVGDRVVPTGVRRHPARLDQHDAVEEKQDVVGRGPNAGVYRLTVSGAYQGPPEYAPLPPYDLHVQRRREGPRQRRLRAVVHDDHLEQLPRVGLAFECREGPRQRLGGLLVVRAGGCLVVRDYNADGPGGRERIERRHIDLPPVVIPNGIHGAKGG